MSFYAHAVLTGDGTVAVTGHGEHLMGLHVETGFEVHGSDYVAVACADDQAAADDMARQMAEAELMRRMA